MGTKPGTIVVVALLVASFALIGCGDDKGTKDAGATPGGSGGTETVGADAPAPSC